MSTADRKVNSPKATLSYPNFDKPRKNSEDDTGDPKFSGAFVFAAGSDLSEMRAAELAAATEFFGSELTVGKTKMSIKDALKKKVIRSAFRDDAEAKGYPEGSIFVNARSKTKPGLVYAYVAPGTDKPAKVADEDITTVFYAGAQVRVNLTAFGYSHSGNKGVSFALNHVQKLGEGERLDNRTSAENEFDAPLGEAPADISGIAD